MNINYFTQNHNFSCIDCDMFFGFADDEQDIDEQDIDEQDIYDNDMEIYSDDKHDIAVVNDDSQFVNDMEICLDDDEDIAKITNAMNVCIISDIKNN